MSIMGYEDDDDGDAEFETQGSVMGWETVGARKARRKRAKLLLPKKPGWRQQLAPGVPDPGEGLQPMPLTGSLNGGVFTAAIQSMNFEARPQAPFRAERLIASVRRTGAAGVTMLADGIFVGRNLQQLELGSFDVEFFGPNAFGVRLSLVQAEPGVLIRIPVRASPAIAGADTVSVSLLFLGRTVR